MAHRRSSIKKIRVDERRRERNVRVMSELKTVTRSVRQLITARKAQEAAAQIRTLFSKLDKAVKKGTLHKNRCSRLKSRLSRQVAALSGA